MSHLHSKPGQVDHTVEVFIVHGDRVLLRKHEKYGIWLSVGGHVELDEDPNQAALREVREEVGLTVELFEPSPTPHFTQPDYRELIPPVFLNRHRINDTHEHVTATYFARSGTDVVTPERASDEWHWFSRRELEGDTKNLRPSVKHYALTALDTLAP
jgi:8-oxo-dGTP pyrophosphatase MutT (NUDIX family)